MTVLSHAFLTLLFTALVYIVLSALGSDLYRTKIFRPKRYRDFFGDVKDFKTLADLQDHRHKWNKESCIISDTFSRKEIEYNLSVSCPSDYTPAMYLNLCILVNGTGEESLFDTECRLLAARHLLQYSGRKEFQYHDSKITRKELIEYLCQHGEVY